MDASEAVKQELAQISATLSKALRDSTPEEWRSVVEKAIQQIDDVVGRIDKRKSGATESQ
jgi:hypothetical protein